jgi:hypothetical protein
VRISGWYAWICLVIVPVCSIALSAIVSNQYAQRAVRAEEAARRDAAEAGRRATCDVVRTQLAIYDTAPPSTATGKEAVRAWTGMSTIYQCT